MKPTYLTFTAILLFPFALGANSSSETETTCSDKPIPIDGKIAIKLQNSDGPWVSEQHGDFVIRVPFDAFRMIIEFRRTKLFMKGLSTAGPDRLLAAFENQRRDAENLKLEDLIPSKGEISAHWTEFEQSDDYQDPEALEASPYSKAVLHAYESIALVSIALQNGAATVVDPSGSIVEEINYYWFSGPDKGGDEVRGVSFKTAEGLEVFSICYIIPAPGS